MSVLVQRLRFPRQEYILKTQRNWRSVREHPQKYDKGEPYSLGDEAKVALLSRRFLWSSWLSRGSRGRSSC